VILWIDEQLSPALAVWISGAFDLTATAVRDLGFAGAADSEIFFAARRAEAVVLTKDRDFIRLLERHGAPPRVLWITLGNTSNERLKTVLGASLQRAMDLFAGGESLVEISEASPVRRVRS
jgi:predicted nuclease of predicted toxin-antitoxin system